MMKDRFSWRRNPSSGSGECVGRTFLFYMKDFGSKWKSVDERNVVVYLTSLSLHSGAIPTADSSPGATNRVRSPGGCCRGMRL